MIGAVFGIVLAGTVPDVAIPLPDRPGCEGEGISVDGGFEQAGFASCSVEPDGSISLRIAPETRPVNPSAWYAARLTQQQLRARTVRLVYRDGQHRYSPWFRMADGAWQRLSAVPIEGSTEGAAIQLPDFAGTAYLAAQPLVPGSTVMQQWAARVADGTIVEVMEARSVEGRAVPLYRAGAAGARTVHVIATRQHPPETTGAAAFDAFAARLLDRAERAGCGDDAVLFAPIVNPDGIARGHWRTNAGLVDTNRDWGRFDQPETAALGGYLTGLLPRATIASVIDFHSTRRGAVYVARSADARAAAFAAAVAAGTGLAIIETRSADGNTLKSWAEDRLGSASFTVELPDSATPEAAANIGRAIADLFARHYLCPVQGESP